jgi:hypothetical protein
MLQVIHLSFLLSLKISSPIVMPPSRLDLN